MANMLTTPLIPQEHKFLITLIYADDSYDTTFCFPCCIPDLEEHIYINHLGKIEHFDKNKATDGNEDVISRNRIQTLVNYNLSFINDLTQRALIMETIDENNFLIREDEVLLDDIKRINSIFLQMLNS